MDALFRCGLGCGILTVFITLSLLRKPASTPFILASDTPANEKSSALRPCFN